MSNKITRIKKKAALIIIAFICIILSLIIFIELAVYPAVVTYCESVLQTKILDIMNESADDVLNQFNPNYNDLAILTAKSDDELSSLEINTVLINKIKTAIANEVSKRVAETEDITVRIPVGSLTGNTFLGGRGPRIPISFNTTSSVFADYKNDFYSVGINQSLHSIIITVRCGAHIVMPLHKKYFETTADFIITESVIVGDVPDNFTEVIEEGSAVEDTVPNIFDYGTVGD